MFVVLLRCSEARSSASQWLAGHQAWLQQGFDDGVFLLSGSLQPQRGGAVLAHATTLDALRQRVQADPFVAHGVVEAEVLDIAASRGDERLHFLLDR